MFVSPSVCLSVMFSFKNCSSKNALLYFLETLQVRAPCHGGLLYSKTCLQGMPLYPRESVPTWQVSLHHRFLNMGQIGHGYEKVSPDHRDPLITVSLEDRFYCIVFDINGMLLEFFMNFWNIVQYFMFSSRFMLFPTCKNGRGGGGRGCQEFFFLKNKSFSLHFSWVGYRALMFLTCTCTCLLNTWMIIVSEKSKKVFTDSRCEMVDWAGRLGQRWL